MNENTDVSLEELLDEVAALQPLDEHEARTANGGISMDPLPVSMDPLPYWRRR